MGDKPAGYSGAAKPETGFFNRGLPGDTGVFTDIWAFDIECYL